MRCSRVEEERLNEKRENPTMICGGLESLTIDMNARGHTYIVSGFRAPGELSPISDILGYPIDAIPG